MDNIINNNPNIMEKNNTLEDVRFKIFIKIITYCLIAVFGVRLFSYTTNILELIGLQSSNLSPLVTVFCLIAIWLQYTSVLVVTIGTFFDIKIINRIIKIFALPSFVVNICLLYPTVELLQGEFSFSVLFFMYAIECVLGIVLSVDKWLLGDINKIKFIELLKTIGVFCLLMICTLPSYFIQFVFGYGNPIYKFNDITFAHRVLLYIGIIVPVIMYFCLRNKTEKVIRFTLIYSSLGALIVFLVNFNYTNFLEPWTWPFHLCNTALFIIPLCLIFKFKKLFYFTYFINVLGALLAMLMPNYSSSTNIFDDRIFVFWYNHWVAFFMPLLIVALKQFARPKIKQFTWSMIWFFGYFALVLVLNVVFSAYGHEVDFFFINGDFIVNKLGDWAENIFKLTASFTLFGKVYEFHPLYQVLFFLVYVVLGLGVWFVYSEFFRVADAHYELHLKLHAIKQYEYAASSSVSLDRKERTMNENLVAKLELKHFSKKYATSKIYAVEDANLEVFAGEIFGFLGPNGAGKSTIIKSMVGIQPITEGNIEICGLDVKSQPVQAKSVIGYVPDHYALYEKLTGREYINYIADIFEVSQKDRDERIEKYIKLFELEHSIDSKIKTYSHGMKQKITIMAALVHEPKVWILDEPLTGLDPNSIYQVKECMKQHAAKGNIVFFSSHIIDIVEKLCGRIAIIKKGHIKCVKKLSEIESTGISLEQFYLNTIEGSNE